MGFGVLNDRHMAMPPGTAKLDERASNEHLPEDTSFLKKDGNIILQPQPSESPNDPLNWSSAWKYSIMFIVAFASGVTVSLGPMITPGLHIIAEQYKVSLDTVSSFMIGLLAFWTGFTTFFTASGANIWGKRPFFVISTVVLLATCIWGYAATTFMSLATMRIFQGVASAPLETLVTSTVSDLFYIHQRGRMLAVWSVMLGSGVLMGQIISGFVINSLGIPAAFGITSIIYAILVPLIYFVIIETTYNTARPTALEIVALQKTGKESRIEESSMSEESKEPYMHRLRLFRGRLVPDSFWKGAFKPVPLILYPAVLFSTIVYGSFFTWLITFGVLSVPIFMAPPYNLNPAQVGLTNIPLLIVAFIATPLSGWMADGVVKWLSKRNSGVFEPEFRLTLMLIAVPLSTIGFIGFGSSIAAGRSIAYPLTFMSLHGTSIPFANQASIAYVIDCHPNDANQAFVTINFAKAVFTFLASTYVNGWYAHSGPNVVFGTIAAINLAICALTVPSYMFGKRLRSMVARSWLARKIQA